MASFSDLRERLWIKDLPPTPSLGVSEEISDFVDIETVPSRGIRRLWNTWISWNCLSTNCLEYVACGIRRLLSTNCLGLLDKNKVGKVYSIGNI